jgi:hypothetical protein
VFHGKDSDMGAICQAREGGVESKYERFQSVSVRAELQLVLQHVRMT